MTANYVIIHLSKYEYSHKVKYYLIPEQTK